MATPTKILMLHGYAQNASIFSKRMAAIRKACGKDVEFVFRDAPKILQAPDLEGFGDLAALAADTSPEDAPRGWWSSNVARTRYREEDLEEALGALRDVLSGNRFDGVLGFSQGAVMAAMLAGLLERPYLRPSFLIDGQPSRPPLKFCISISGFLPPPPFSSLLTPFYSTPTLHIIGLADPIVSPAQAHTLVAANDSEYKCVAEHEGGHFVPSKAKWRVFLREWMRDPRGGVRPPTPEVEVVNVGVGEVGMKGKDGDA